RDGLQVLAEQLDFAKTGCFEVECQLRRPESPDRMLVPDYLAVGAVDLGHRLAGGGGIERALADHPIVAVDLHVHGLERAGPARPVARLQSEATTGRKHL